MTDATRTNVTVTVNGRTVNAQPGELLIEVAERAGEYVPRFCYHPRMEPVGVCRMCLVEVEGPRGPSLQPACYLRVNDGMTVTTNSDKVKKAQDGVLEFLLANHPLDCPVCDKGGECPLQDQTLAHGSGETRFVEEKRHFVKPIPIGENVLLDRERCIQCSRCTRFAAEVAGDAQIAFSGRGDLIEVAPSPSEPFDSVFSGNTVQICPVGALTAKPYRFSARPWDLEQVESTCTTCAVGCRVAVQSSGNRLTRVLGVDAEPVNHGWLCDKGRFTLDAVDSTDGGDILSATTRVTQPMIRQNGTLVETSWGTALARAAELLRDGGARVGAIGGAALTNEGAYAFERLFRQVLGSNNLDAQFDDGLDPVLVQALPAATIDEAANARVVVTLCGDLKEEAPVLYLRLRENITRRKNTLVALATGPSDFHALARHVIAVRPGEAATVVKSLRDGAAPLGTLVDADALSAVREVLGDGTGVVFVVGRPNMAERASIVEEAIVTLHQSFPAACFLPVLKRANVRGALDMGLHPSLRPGRGFDDSASGRDTPAQLTALREGEQAAVVILGGCLLGNVLDTDLATAALEAGSVIAVTGHGGATLAYADVVLPAQVQHERAGTVTNLEGRVTAVAPKITAPGSAWSDVAIAAELAAALGADLGLDSLDGTAKDIEESTGYPALSVLSDNSYEGVLASSASSPRLRKPMDPMAFPGVRSTKTVGIAGYAGATETMNATHVGSVTPATMADVKVNPVEVPTADGYALRVVVARRLYDHGVAMQGSPALHGLIEPTTLRAHHIDIDRLALEEDMEVTVTTARGSFALPLVCDDDVIPGTLVVYFATRASGGANVVASLADPSSAYAQVRLATR